MKNPFEILGIAETTTENDVIRALEERLLELQELSAENQKAFTDFHQKGLIFAGNTRVWDRLSIEEDLAEQFACGVEPTSKFMGYDALMYVNKKIKEDLDSKKIDRTSYRFLANAVSAHIQRVIKETARYQKVLDAYHKNEKSDEARAALEDLYIRMKFEDAVVALGSDITKKAPHIGQGIQDKTAFMQNLEDDPRYMELNVAYQNIATDKSRTDMVPELYVKSRLGNPGLLAVANPEWKEHIIKRERAYYQLHLEEQADRLLARTATERDSIPINQNHDYSWGVILTNPSYVMKGIPVNNADFSGRMTVKHLGYFSAESLFAKRKFLKEKYEDKKVYLDEVAVAGKRLRLQITEHLPNPNIPAHMREYYYKRQATKQLYDSVYMVSKTDTNGVSHNSLVFSPVTPEEFKTEIPQEFTSNVYFSEYALDIARQNGGFAGAIVDTPKGLSISTAYSQDEIASGVLFQSRTIGRIIDKTAKEPTWKDIDSSEAETILLSNGLERERSKDE